MAYKFATGSVYRGDIYHENDAEKNTYLDWSDNAFGIVTDGSLILAISSSVVSSSVNLSASAFYGDGSNLSNIAGGGAPTDAQYVTLATDGDLSAERVLTAGDGIDFNRWGSRQYHYYYKSCDDPCPMA